MKAALGVILGAIAAMFAAFFAGSKSKANEISAKSTQKAKDVSDKTHKVAIEGMRAQDEIRDEDIDPDNRTGSL